MISETVTKETRPGAIFTGRVGEQRLDRIPVQLFLEGQEGPVGTIEVNLFECTGGNESFLDKAFQRWVTDGLFYGTVRDPSLLSVLASAQDERLREVPWYRKTFRFLPAAGSSYRNPRFVLTTDKNDLPDRYKQILEVGEEVVQREEAEQEEARKLRAKEQREREERLRAEHSQLIIQAAKTAISERVMPAESARALSELGLLKSSTTFRGGALFPGEAWILWYDFTEGEARYAGYIGFDVGLQLISVDARFPEERQTYLRAS